MDALVSKLKQTFSVNPIVEEKANSIFQIQLKPINAIIELRINSRETIVEASDESVRVKIKKIMLEDLNGDKN